MVLPARLQDLLCGGGVGKEHSIYSEARHLRASPSALRRSFAARHVRSFIEPLGQTGRRKKYYQFTAIDDCTRLRVLRAYPRCDQKTAIAFVDDVMAKLPFQMERVQTDIQAWWRPEDPWIVRPAM